MVDKSYTSDHIRVLDELTHIRTAPGMYIGDTSTATHLLEEALDNSLDECLAGYANIIAVTYDSKDNVYSVIDNGRGIPIDKDVPITISSKLFSGSKFQDSKSAYEISCGLHGVGLCCVNALSDIYDIEIFRDGKKAIFNFRDAKLTNKSITSFKGERPYSTTIRFKPNKKYFEKAIVDMDRIRRRLVIASVELPKCYFVISIDGQKEVINHPGKETFFKKECLNDNELDLSPIFNFTCKIKVEELRITFCYSFNSSITPRILSSVNLLPVDSGGTHVNMFFDIVKDYFGKAKKNGFKFQPNDALVGLRSYISLELVKPEFSGQTKDKLINRKESLKRLFDEFTKQLNDYFTKNPEQLNDILTAFDEYRKKVDSKKLKNNLNTNKRVSTKLTKLRDCTSGKGELFICEGDSAAGSLIQSRDPRIHAILPLKGKIPNIVNAKDILSNNEIRELVQAMGCGIGPHFEIEKLKYEKIICATDNDFDGYHIASLLTMIMAVLFPEVVKAGKFYISHGPLYSINEPKNFVPLWTKEDLEKARSMNKRILYAKGLGEFNPSQIKVCLLDKETRKLLKVTYSEHIEKLTLLFSDVNAKRELLKGE